MTQRVTRITSERWKNLFVIKIQDRLFCKQLVLKTAQFSQLNLAVSFHGQVWNFPFSHLLPNSPFLWQANAEWSGRDVSMRHWYAEGDSKARSNLEMDIIKIMLLFTENQTEK